MTPQEKIQVFASGVNMTPQEKIQQAEAIITICKRILTGEQEEYGLMRRVFLPKKIKLYKRYIKSLRRAIRAEDTA